jgi:hypothetical protein
MVVASPRADAFSGTDYLLPVKSHHGSGAAGHQLAEAFRLLITENIFRLSVGQVPNRDDVLLPAHLKPGAAQTASVSLLFKIHWNK